MDSAQRGSGGGVEKQLNSTWILKIEPAEFIRSLAWVYETKSNQECLQGFRAEKLGRLELPFTELGNTEVRKGWGNVNMDVKFEMWTRCPFMVVE